MTNFCLTLKPTTRNDGFFVSQRSTFEGFLQQQWKWLGFHLPSSSCGHGMWLCLLVNWSMFWWDGRGEEKHGCLISHINSMAWFTWGSSMGYVLGNPGWRMIRIKSDGVNGSLGSLGKDGMKILNHPCF